MKRLSGLVAVVTGASRGGGRGIACVLGEEGATVYVTGRSVRGEPTTGGLPGTIQETAEQVTARGGRGIALRVDHTVNEQVQALFEQVRREQGHLDLLVNNAWGGYENMDAPFDGLFWELPLWRWDRMVLAGVRSHMVASYYAVPLMLTRRRGLIINTTWDTGSRNWNFDAYDDTGTGVNVFYDTAKTAIDRMIFAMAHQLRPYNIAALTLSPGWMRTEDVLRRFQSDEGHWQDVPGLARTESVEYIGRAVAALATDADVIRKTGHLYHVADLAREYRFTDADGRYVPRF